ncbi:MAG: hypothetical protein CL780_00565 [Chloroflexi bacterium]|nr:hypothetical protein [Chloroflexota bacterium]
MILRNKIFYGWFIVAALFIANILVLGGVRNGFGIFVEIWEKEFYASTASISFAASIGLLTQGIAQPILGRLADIYGGRIIILNTMIILVLGGFAIALANGVIFLIFIYGIIISFASGGIGGSVSGVVIVRWFRKRRGTALSVLAAGGSVGGLICVPLMAYIMDLYNWRVSWIVLGLLGVISIPVIWIIIKNRPSELGMCPDGENLDNSKNFNNEDDEQGPLVVNRWKDSLKSWPIWQLSAGYFVCGVTTSSIGVHYIRWAISEDVSTNTAALAFGVLSAINAISVVIVGIFADRIERRTMLGAVYLLRGLAFVALIVFPGYQAVWIFALLGGMSWLATVPLTSSLTADIYGVKNLGTLFGLASLSHAIGGAIATYLFGYAFDLFGSYDIPFLFGIITLLGAGVASLSIKEKKYSLRYIKKTA